MEVEEVYGLMNGKVGKLNRDLTNKGESERSFPRLYIIGNVANMSKDIAKMVGFKFIRGTEEYNGYCEIKWQGSSSLAYSKKNYTIKLYDDIGKKIKKKIDVGYGSEYKYCLKANFIDHSHSRNVVSARLWSKMVSSRKNPLPQELVDSPNYGAIDGFPIKVYVNGIYQGLYCFNIPKDGWMFNMDEDNPNHCVLCGEQNNYGNNTLALSCEFRALAQIDNPGFVDWSLEFPDALPTGMKDSFNTLVGFVLNSYDSAAFKAGIGNYLDVESAIDYYIYMYLNSNIDGIARNMIMLTYDKVKWYCSAYDLDGTWGLKPDGLSFLVSDIKFQDDYLETNSKLWKMLVAAYPTEITERYKELRKGVLSSVNIIKEFEKFTSEIPSNLYAEDLVPYSDIPSVSTNNISQIRSYVTQRGGYVDGKMKELSSNITKSLTNISTIEILGRSKRSNDTSSLASPATFADAFSSNSVVITGGGQTITLPITAPLRSTFDESYPYNVRDKICRVNGQWGVQRNVGVSKALKADGDNWWDYSAADSTGDVLHISCNKHDCKRATNGITVTRYVANNLFAYDCTNLTDTLNSNFIVYSTNDTSSPAFRVRVKKSLLTGYSDTLTNAEKTTLIINYLNGLGLKFYYPLLTPTFTAFSAELQDKLNALIGKSEVMTIRIADGVLRDEDLIVT